MRRSLCLLCLFALLWPASAKAAQPRLSEAARWLQEYLRIDTTNPPGGEHRAAAFLAYLLHRERIPTKLFVTPEGRVSLYARLAASEPGGGALVLSHHLDVVPAGPGWTVGPFAGRIVDGRLMGRGALDTKGLGIAHLAAFIDLKRRGVPLARDVVFLAVADEEQGGAAGMAWLFEHHPELFAHVWAAFNEGGASRAVIDRLLWWEVEVAQKRPLWLRVATRGLPGHASTYNPDSATHLLISALDRVLERPPRYRITPAARRYFAALAPLHGAQYRRAFANLDEVIGPDGPTIPLLPGLRKLFLDTVQVTVIHASDSINVVPATASATLDIRLLPDTDAEAFLASLRQTLGEDAEVGVLVSAPPAAPSPTDHPAYRAAAAVLGESAPVVPSLLAGFTDSRHFRARGIPAYGLSPFALDALEGRGIHAADEGIPLDELDAGVERMRRIVSACAQHRD